ncbi:MAG: hypothetical protein HGA45_00060 [Chloroflexales bacterium]|nr:hypothetical protein [Chloroflexales bacterium]
MPGNEPFDDARRKLDQALRSLETADDVQAPPLNAPPADEGRQGAQTASPGDAPSTPGDAPARPPAPTTEALTRLVVGAALLGLDGLAARSDDWEAAAGIARAPAAQVTIEGQIGSGRFRHALIGWIFEAEEQLRPRGSPIAWMRSVVAYLFGTVFSVVLELLPLPRLGRRRGLGARAEPTDEDTRRWIRRGTLEEPRARAFAQAALEDIAHQTIVYLARRPAVQQALGEIVRSPAMDDAVRQIVAGPVIEQAIARVAASPALDSIILKVAESPALDATVRKIVRSPVIEEAVTHIVHTPAMEEAVRHLVGTQAMADAIETLSRSPALVELVTTQGSSVASEILEEVRERGVSGDQLLEGIARRIMRRPPRSKLPVEARGLLLADALQADAPDDAGRR